MEVQLLRYDVVNDLVICLLLMAMRMGFEPTRDREIPTRVATGADTRFRVTSPRSDGGWEEWMGDPDLNRDVGIQRPASYR